MVEKSEDYRVIYDDAEADGQHMELFTKFDEFMRAVDNKACKKDLLQMFTFLDGYVSSHFATEEKLLAQYAYPDAHEHREEHRNFICDMWAVKSKLASGGSLDEALSTTTWALVAWLSHHVGHSDVAAGECIRKCRDGCVSGKAPSGN